MALSQNGYVNGTLSSSAPNSTRFSDIPPAIEIAVDAVDAEEAVEVDLEGLPDDPTELCTLLENEGADRGSWMTAALAYAKFGKVDQAIEVLTKAVAIIAQQAPKDRLSVLSCLCWLDLWKSREAPRMIPEGTLVSEAKTKDYYLKASTTILNDASRINPSFPPLFLARGVLYLLRASLQPPSQTRTSGSQDQSERVITIRQAMKCFDDALRVSSGKNMLAVLGRARAQYSLEKYAEALEGYQEVLSKTPELSDPDPRIGIGCCLWQLGFKDEAKVAWERAIEVNHESPLPNVLIGLYYLDSGAHLPITDPYFLTSFKKAMTDYTQRAFKLNKDLPLTCVTFASYFYSRKAWPTVESLARRAIEFTDVNAIASDGWFLLARKEHLTGDRARAIEFYRKADEARGGLERGYLPAKLGIAQLQALMNDLDGAKFRLEKIIQQSKSIEARILLGTIYAEEVFASQAGSSREDKSNERRKAIALLEAARLAWKDSHKKTTPDSSVLISLARLYENESPEKSLQCLVQAEQIDVDQLADTEDLGDAKDEAARAALLREQLSPHLLNNIACFHYAAEKHEQARAVFQIALNACVRRAQKDESFDTDATVTTISYNLARAYEADGLLEEAKKVYEGLLERHNDYTDATTRLAYIALRQSPTDEGPKAVTTLIQNDPFDLEARAMYGWYLSKSKKRSTNIAEDLEQRHYKHTLQHHDKHDRYSLTGMGNLYLTNAREMRRDSESDREKRRKTYERAVEFFDKALQLDPRNAYAAQGISIALVEDKKDYSSAVQVLVKLRDTLRDSNVSVNVGHVYAELKQYSRAIENYEMALSKDRGRDPQVLACLGRVWLLKGKQERSLGAIKRSLEYSQQALEIANDQIHFKFNVAFVQIQLAHLIYTLGESQRTSAEVQAAAEGLDEAIESLSEIAQSKNPPYPKNDIEQRASMGRNTMRKQLERALQSQREYEEKNAAKLQQARQQREVEMQRRDEERRKADEDAMERKRRIAEERQKIHEQDRELAEKRAEEERKKEEADMETDSETGEKVKKKKKGGKRKKKAEEETDTGGSGTEGEPRRSGRKKRRTSRVDKTPESEEESSAPKKRRRVERRSAAKAKGKYKSSEIVVDSDNEEDGDEGQVSGKAGTSTDDEPHDPAMQLRDDMGEASEDEEAMTVAPTRSSRKKITRAIGDSDDDDEGVTNGDHGAQGEVALDVSDPVAMAAAAVAAFDAAAAASLQAAEDEDGDAVLDDISPSTPAATNNDIGEEAEQGQEQHGEEEDATMVDAEP